MKVVIRLHQAILDKVHRKYGTPRKFLTLGCIDGPEDRVLVLKGRGLTNRPASERRILVGDDLRAQVVVDTEELRGEAKAEIYSGSESRM